LSIAFVVKGLEDMIKKASGLSVILFIVLVSIIGLSMILPVNIVRAADRPQCWGVFVGISDYKYINDLKYCDDDAVEYFDKMGVAWGMDHVRSFTNSQATKSAILNSIAWLGEKAGPDDTVMFEFSGHGDRSNPGYFYCYNSLLDSYSNDISAVELAAAFRQVSAAKTVIILDCCFSGTFEYEMAQNGRVIMMACRDNQYSEESGELGNGVYSYFVLKAIDNFSAADSNGDYELTAEEIAAYAESPTYDFDKFQNPVLNDGYSGDLALLAQFFFKTDLPSGNKIITIDGVSYTTFNGKLWSPGTHIVSVPDMVDSGAGTRWIFKSWNDGNTSLERAISKGMYSASYDTERRLKLNSTYGELQGAGWYKDKTSAAFSVTDYVGTPDTRHYFTGWSGDYTGDTASASVIMNNPKTITANWRSEYLLTVNSAYGSPSGADWYKEGGTAAILVVDFIELPDTRHYFTGWSGDYYGDTASASLVMDKPKTVTANWRHEYLLTVTSPYGSPTGTEWYKEGATAGFSIQDYIETPDTRHYFTGWNGDFSGDTALASVVMGQPKTITAGWRNEYLVTLNSEYGNATGAGWYSEGQPAAISVEPVQGVIIRQIFDGWSGDFNDKNALSSVMVNAPKVITARWHTDYLQLYLLIGGTIIVIGIVAAAGILVRRKEVRA
jgi:hypothetical protein